MKYLCITLFAFAVSGCGQELAPLDEPVDQCVEDGEVCVDPEALCEECSQDGCDSCTTPVCELDCVDAEAVCESCTNECEVCPEPCEDRCFVLVPGECERVCVQERYGRCCKWEDVCEEDTFRQIECPGEDGTGGTGGVEVQ